LDRSASENSEISKPQPFSRTCFNEIQRKRKEGGVVLASQLSIEEEEKIIEWLEKIANGPNKKQKEKKE